MNSHSFFMEVYRLVIVDVNECLLPRGRKYGYYVTSEGWFLLGRRARIVLGLMAQGGYRHYSRTHLSRHIKR